ncbi:MAG: site-specific integrase [Sedimentisphaerales bacterium]|nr:site-specific integrase [Sedimentisphaerales bacterium]
MKKAWVYKRKGIKGWWTGWYENGKRKAKAFPTKSLAEHFRNIKYTQLNSDVFTSVVDFDWNQMTEEYRQCKQVEGLEDVSIYEILLTLRHFKRIVAPNSSREITQQNLDMFVLKRGEEIGKNTLNKDITNLHAFLSWAAKNRFVASGLQIKKVKVPQRPVVSLSPKQVRDLMMLASRYPTLRLRILLAVTTGLRRGDIETIRIGDIHFGRNAITTHNRKSKRSMPERPIPEQVTTELCNYVATLPDGQDRLFPDKFSRKKWEKVRKAAGLPDLKFHDLRKTFASLLAQRGVSTAVTQRLLEHSSPQLTNEVYTNVDPVLRQAVNLLPVAEWL